MKDLFVPYELALLAKEKGFDEPCLSCYMPNKELIEDYYYSIRKPCINHNNKPYYPAAPLYQQLVDWFREKHMIKFIEEEKFITIRYQGTPIFYVKKAGSKKIGPFILPEAINNAFELIS